MNGTGATTCVSWAVVATKSAVGSAAYPIQLSRVDHGTYPRSFSTDVDLLCADRKNLKAMHPYNMANPTNRIVQKFFWKPSVNVGSIINGYVPRAINDAAFDSAYR